MACRLPETLNTEISKACNSIFPLQNVNIRKVKMLKAPKFDCTLVCCSVLLFRMLHSTTVRGYAQ
jgi:ribosomal protein S3AE